MIRTSEPGSPSIGTDVRFLHRIASLKGSRCTACSVELELPAFACLGLLRAETVKVGPGLRIARQGE